MAPQSIHQDGEKEGLSLSTSVESLGMRIRKSAIYDFRDLRITNNAARYCRQSAGPAELEFGQDYKAASRHRGEHAGLPQPGSHSFWLLDVGVFPRWTRSADLTNTSSAVVDINAKAIESAFNHLHDETCRRLKDDISFFEYNL